MHDFSDRAGMPFMAIHCRGFSSDYLEEEIFGKKNESDEMLAPGSKLRMAQWGTLFFSHIEEFPRSLQRHLTQVLKVNRLDSRNGCGARLLFSSNKSPLALAAQGLFDEELAVRISRAPLTIPSLAERPGDIALLVDATLAKAEARGFRPALSPEAVGLLKNRPWPGNVRQIEQAVDCLIHIPGIANAALAEVANRLSILIGDSNQSVPSVEDMEKNLIRKAVAMYPTKDQAAEALRIGRATLYRKLKLYGLS
jgi:DNA-binding NtrC family response regulator